MTRAGVGASRWSESIMTASGGIATGYLPSKALAHRGGSRGAEGTTPDPGTSAGNLTPRRARADPHHHHRGRLDEAPPLAAPANGGGPAAAQDAPALLPGQLDVRQHLVAVPRRDQRALIRVRLQRVADLEPPGLGDE